MTYLIRLDPDFARASLWMENEGLSRGKHRDGGEHTDDGYGWHALLCAAFGKARAPKPFRIVARRGRPVQLLAYSALSADDLVRFASDFADPAVHASLNIDQIAGKAMPYFAQGRRLGFSVLVRPTIRTDRNGNRNKSCELDAYIHARASGDFRPKEVIYIEWAKARLTAGGATLHDLSIDGLDGAPVLRRGAETTHRRPLTAINGTSVGLKGTLSVAESTSFANLLSKGVGRHRAFGFGMILLSPPEI